MNCKVSGQYGKDNDKVLHFYCENCGKEMEYNEKRICFAENGTQSPTPNYNDILSEFIEKGADLEHDRWARWQKYFFSKCLLKPQSEVNGLDDRFIYFALSKDLYTRWNKQIETSYQYLSEEEKESDRKETRNYIPIIQQAITQATERAVKKKENETKTIIKKNVKEINWWFIKNADKKGGRIYEGMENQMYALNDILSQLTKE